MTECRWLFPNPISEPEWPSFSAELGRARVVAELLWRRGFRSIEQAGAFTDPRLRTLSDPMLLPDMEAAVTRIFAAIDGGQKIALYGDYDVDGVTSLALLTRVLRALGANSACFLPHRIDEGYGLSAEGVARCVEEHRPELLIAVDCGTTAVAEIAALRQKGVDVIVIDHHESAEELPRCTALVNPKRGDRFRYLCSVGLVFKVAHALLKRRPVPTFALRETLDLVALGSVADLVPLEEENRVLVKHGLVQLAQTKWRGLRELIKVSGLSFPLKPSDVGFGLGPRLNAAGRLGTAQDALELLLTEDETRARTIATALDAQNRERRSVEESVVVEAEKQIAQWFDPQRFAAIVVGARGWHPGVIGIAASRVQKRYHRPTFVVGFDDEGHGKGSGRSIEGLSLVEALTRCGEHLDNYGGHEMAAGLSVREERFPQFKEAFEQAARSLLTDEQLLPRLRLDAEIALGDINLDLLAELESLQPFGMGNHSPVFYARRVQLAAEPRVMKEKHLSLELRQGGAGVRAVWFGGAAHDLPKGPWDIAFSLERNEYQGYVRAQMQVRAVRASG